MSYRARHREVLPKEAWYLQTRKYSEPEPRHRLETPERKRHRLVPKHETQLKRRLKILIPAMALLAIGVVIDKGLDDTAAKLQTPVELEFKSNDITPPQVQSVGATATSLSTAIRSIE